MNQDKVLDISWGTILKISITVVLTYILYLIKDILILFIFALIISILFNPAIEFLKKRRIPRPVAVIFMYFSVFGLLGFLLFLASSFLIEEIKQFAQLLPQYFERLSPYLQSFGIPVAENIESYITVIGGNLEQVTKSIASALFTLFGGIFSTLFIITMAIFISLEQKPIERALLLFFPKRYEAYLINLWERCQGKVNGWFITRIFACAFVGVFTYFALLLFNAKYPFSLGLMAGILNFVPVVGPIITGAMIVLVAALDNFTRSLFALAVFTLIQQAENNVITPILSKKIIDLPPALVLISLAIGGRLWGVLGAILVIPLVGIIYEFLKEFLQRRKEAKSQVYE